MRAVVQRVSRAEVAVGGDVVGEIGTGLLVLVGVAAPDTDADARAVAAKIGGMRIFSDEEGKMNRSLGEVAGGVLLVSQFTLLADTGRGRRPSFTGAAAPAVAEVLVRLVADELRRAGIPVATGSFGANMQVTLVNDGPVTIIVEAAGGRVL
ncbi:MAG TPA: D-aminoacyl-tRNA deacylase [Acidimicrobiia bacterium]|jgi:D-tyrosyl-tRNA(Tyr) deacylase